MPIQQLSVKYKTHLKRALVEALRSVINTHEDTTTIRSTRVNIEMPLTQTDYPAIIVRYFEREVRNAGVGHIEFREKLQPAPIASTWIPVKHALYTGSVEFAIYALSATDRDLLSDVLIETLSFGDIGGQVNGFFDRIYHPANTIDSQNHFINLNTDQIQGFGENQAIAPWMPEDVLVYQVSYRVDVFGEFYSRIGDKDYPILENVRAYPWLEDIEEVPTGDPNDPAIWNSYDDTPTFYPGGIV